MKDKGSIIFLNIFWHDAIISLVAVRAAEISLLHIEMQNMLKCRLNRELLYAYWI